MGAQIRKCDAELANDVEAAVDELAKALQRAADTGLTIEQPEDCCPLLNGEGEPYFCAPVNLPHYVVLRKLGDTRS